METKEKDIQSQPKPTEEDISFHDEQVEKSAPNNHVEEDEIDLADLMKQVWVRRKVALYAALVTFILGIFIAMFSPEEYNASIVLMPQSSSSSGNVTSGLLRQFGGLAGLGLGDGGTAGTLSPNLYPDITQSTPFFLQMIEEEFYFSTLDTTLTFTQYFGNIQKPGVLDYMKKYTLGLPRVIINIPANIINSFKAKPTYVQDKTEHTEDSLAIRPSMESVSAREPITLTGKQLSVINKIKDRIQTTIEPNGTVKVSVEMPDPQVAAKTTEMAVQYLTNYILEYRTEKAQQDLEFVERQYNEKKEKYNIAQQKLARFQDRNTNIFTESARIELERLRTENNLAFNLYQGLAQQLEQAKIKVQEETPVFKVLEPIQVPLSISKPNRELILFLSLFVGIFLGFGIIFLRILFSNIKNKIA